MSETDRPGPSHERTFETGAGDRPMTSEREAYFQALRLWIQQAQMYQSISSCFPYYMISLQGMQNAPTNVPLLNNNYQFHGQQFPFQVPFAQRAVPEGQVPATVLSPAEVIQRHGGYEYIIPPLYKRLLAEFIDFMLLFILKLIVTFVAVDMFDIINLICINSVKIMMTTSILSK
ncbi:unnamed protein product [Leptidea sinapis]|uniref:RDD domain-containing protein n=1 Tax=Leptidea sinapis TaxID=189913 RepID=A0A5E4Q5R3_9NEOP|nr:unnamed protein product [Leptidea sinapis]